LIALTSLNMRQTHKKPGGDVTQKEPGLLRTSLRFVKQALNENALLRFNVLGTVLVVTLACIALSAFGVTYSLDPKKSPEAYSPWMFGILYLPAEFLIYDLILGNPAPRTSLKQMYLDWRLLRLFIATIQSMLAVLLPAAVPVLLLIGLGQVLTRGGKMGWPAGLAVGVGTVVVVCAASYFLFRFFYLSIAVARRAETPVRTAFRETKGRMWRIGCVLLLPYLAIGTATLLSKIVGSALESSLGFVGLAPWFLFDAGLTGFTNCLTAAVLAFSYQRVILRDVIEKAQAADAAATPDQGPQGG
jgi:hypothetical protein